MALSALVSPLLDSIWSELADSDAARTLMDRIHNGTEGPHWVLDGGLIRYKVAIIGRKSSKTSPIPRLGPPVPLIAK
nr:hypothetical protein Iba_chr12bCG17570 [Ipomoea batatas]